MKVTLKCLCIFIFALNSAYSQEEKSNWRLQHPVVVASEAMDERVRFMNLFPANIVWLKNQPYVSVLRNPKVDPELEIYREMKDRSWKSYSRIRGMNFPTVFTVKNNDSLGVVGSVGKDKRGGYGNQIHFYRIFEGEAKNNAIIGSPFEENSRITVSSVGVYENTIYVFMLREIRGKDNEIMMAVSQDGGLSWLKTKKIGDTSMNEDWSHVQCLCFNKSSVVLFLKEREGNFLYKTEDSGKSWKKSAVNMDGGLSNAKSRPLLGKVLSAKEAVVVFMAKTKGNLSKYYISRTDDQGKSWSKAVAMTEDMKMEDPSAYVQLAKAGDRIAFSYMKVVGRWIQGDIENHIVVSQDKGQSWKKVPLDKYYNGIMLFSALSESPDNSRIVYSTAIRMKKKGARWCYLVSQEYSGRKIPEADLGEVKQLVANLGHKDFKVRKASSERLAILGVPARKELISASKSKDPEVASRAKELLEKLFPECLKTEAE